MFKGANINTLLISVLILLALGIITYLVWFVPKETSLREYQLEQKLNATAIQRDQYKHAADSAAQTKVMWENLTQAALAQVSKNKDTIKSITKNSSTNHAKNEARINADVNSPWNEFLRHFSDAADTIR